jgi:hypothetical protein
MSHYPDKQGPQLKAPCSRKACTTNKSCVTRSRGPTKSPGPVHSPSPLNKGPELVSSDKLLHMYLPHAHVHVRQHAGHAGHQGQSHVQVALSGRSRHMQTCRRLKVHSRLQDMARASAKTSAPQLSQLGSMEPTCHDDDMFQHTRTSAKTRAQGTRPDGLSTYDSGHISLQDMARASAKTYVRRQVSKRAGPAAQASGYSHHSTRR